MSRIIHILLAALLLWLPVSQAWSACCPMAAGGADVPMVMPHDCADGATELTPGAMHEAGDCQGECMQMGQLAAVVGLPMGLHPDQPVRDLRVALLTRVLPAHQDPLLRPPRQSA